MGLSLFLIGGHAMTLLGVETVIGRHGHLSLVGSAAPDGHALAEAVSAAADVVWLDMPSRERAQTLSLVRGLSGQTSSWVVVHTEAEDPDTVGAAVECGADAVVSKREDLRELVRSLAALSRGGRPYLSPRLLPDDARAASGLTTRQREVLSRVADGLDTDRIAEAMGIAPDTVRTHLKGATARLGAANRAELVARGFRHGVIA